MLTNSIKSVFKYMMGLNSYENELAFEDKARVWSFYISRIIKLYMT